MIGPFFVNDSEIDTLFRHVESETYMIARIRP